MSLDPKRDYYEFLINKIKDKPGDIVECGVYLGSSLVLFTLLCPDRHVWGFDSFEGLPEPATEDLAKPHHSSMKKGSYKATIEDVVRGFNYHSVSMQNVTLVQGMFENTLPKYNGNPISFLHVDVDLYEGYKTCLNMLWPFVVEGGVVPLDEYDYPDEWPGAVTAVDEFLKRTSNAEINKFRTSYEDRTKCYLVKM